MNTTTHKREALQELRKLFVLRRELQVNVQMWSEFVDETWHDMSEHSGYRGFCFSACGGDVAHVREAGFGQITWIKDYEKRYGSLPLVWFLDRYGKVRSHLYQRYRSGRAIWTSWDCVPVPVEPMAVPRNKEVDPPRAGRNSSCTTSPSGGEVDKTGSSLFSEYTPNEAEETTFAEYLEALSRSFCPYIAESQKQSAFETTKFRILCAPTIFCERRLIALYTLREVYRFINIRRHLPTDVRRFLCFNILIYAHEDRSELDWRLAIGLVHWMMKKRFSRFGIMFGKFWPGESLLSKKNRLVPDPPCGIISIRSGYLDRDVKFFSMAPECLSEFVAYHTSGSPEASQDPLFKQTMSSNAAELMSNFGRRCCPCVGHQCPRN